MLNKSFYIGKSHKKESMDDIKGAVNEDESFNIVWTLHFVQ